MVGIIGGLYILVAIAVLALRREYFAPLLISSAAFPTTAAVTMAKVSISPFYLLAFVAAISVAIRWITPDRKVGAPRWVASFVILAIVVTAIGPTIFQGTPVLETGIDQSLNFPIALQYSNSMIAQVAYLCLGVAVALYLKNHPNADGRHLQVVFAVGIGFSSLRLAIEAAGMAWPATHFQNFAGADYTAVTDGRHYGVFSEPSALAIFCLGAMSYFIASLGRRSVRQLSFSSVMLVLSVLNLTAARSGTAVLGTMIMIILAVLVSQYHWWLHKRKFSLVTVLLPLIGLAYILAGFPGISEYMAVVAEKRVSDSATNRMGADLFALSVLRDTWGLGVGLGANRTSSLATYLLSAVGIAGTTIFVGMVVRALLSRTDRTGTAAAKWALVAVIVGKCLAEPGLSNPLLWVILGSIWQIENYQRTSSTTGAGRVAGPCQSAEAVYNPHAGPPEFFETRGRVLKERF